ncbi:hypothetical protein GCK72_010016 [Caenorhabditis remanei]|uniref:Major sperm protein n=1 Tax=Caenorhabditis remanei TaxID=31234 RepID=A0A6A5H1S1_CAERE|nr:hypothetical protein GCK72_010016 [Caenorhabditis remanei]KAF1761760.1 hypothetical protein GCK72_010016 [Caenorhabditis remanei]
MTEKKQFIATEPSDKIRFTAESQDEQKTVLKITNQSEMKQAFKACNVSDFILLKLFIFRGGQGKPPVEKQQFGVYHIPAPENCTCEGAWAEHYGPPQGEHKLKVVFNE